MSKHKRGNPLDDADSRETVVVPSGDRPLAGDPRGAPGGRDSRAADVVAVPEGETEHRSRGPRPGHLASKTRSRSRPAGKDAGSDDGSGAITVQEKETDAGTAVVGVLVAIKGPIPGFVARLFEGSNVLGRGGDPDLIPTRSETRAISRRHATVEAEAGAFVIEPVGPVFVNERRIGDRTLLSHGDQVRLGRTLTFVLLVVP